MKTLNNKETPDWFNTVVEILKTNNYSIESISDCSSSYVKLRILGQPGLLPTEDSVVRRMEGQDPYWDTTIILIGDYDLGIYLCTDNNNHQVVLVKQNEDYISKILFFNDKFELNDAINS